MPTDTFGRDVVEKKPKQPETVGQSARDWSSLISSSLDVETVISYLSSAERGMLRYQMEMFDRMIERDPHLQAVLQTRRLALTQSEWSVLPGDETDTRAADAAEYTTEQLKNLDDFEDDVHALLDAVPKGISCCEIIYNRDWGLERLQEIPQKLLDWSDPELRVMADGVVPVEMAPNKFILHSPRIKPGSPLRRGLMRTLAVYWCISHFAMEDWAGYAEVFGSPIRVGKYPFGSLEAHRDILWEALQNIGTDAAGMIPDNMNIEFLEPMSRQIPGGSLPTQGIIDHIERKMSISVLGQNLTTESQSGTGTLAGGAHERVRRDLTRADARQLATTLRRDLFRPLVGFKFGFDTPLPVLKWNLDDPVNQESRVNVFKTAIEMGQPVSKAQVREELELWEPEDEDDVLEKSAPAPSPFEQEFSARQRGLITGDNSVTLYGGATGLPAYFSEAGSTLPPGSAMRANQRLASAAAEDQADALDQVLSAIEKLAANAESLDGLLTRIKLMAPDIEDVLKRAGMSLEEFEDLCARSLVTADLNGRVAVGAEQDA
jgi:phage gp29-like protein